MPTAAAALTKFAEVELMPHPAGARLELHHGEVVPRASRPTQTPPEGYLQVPLQNGGSLAVTAVFA